jgi:hypothetical protein
MSSKRRGIFAGAMFVSQQAAGNYQVKMSYLSFRPSLSCVNKFQTDRSSLFSPYPAFRVYLWWLRNWLRYMRPREEEPKSATSCSLARGMFRMSVLAGKPVLYPTGTIFLLRCRLTLSCRLLGFKIFCSLSTVDYTYPKMLAKSIPYKLLIRMELLTVLRCCLTDKGLYVFKIFSA